MDLLYLVIPLAVLFWIVAIADVVRSELSSDKKIIWGVAVTVFPLIGAWVYFQMKNRVRRQQRHFDPKFRNRR